jgi:hypothetical protein
MGPWDAFNHLLNFVAPAAAVALLLTLGGRFFRSKQAPALAWWAQIAIVFAVGLATLAGGLWWLGSDSRMLTYTALVVATATCQWFLVGGWRR